MCGMGKKPTCSTVSCMWRGRGWGGMQMVYGEDVGGDAFIRYRKVVRWVQGYLQGTERWPHGHRGIKMVKNGGQMGTEVFKW